MNEIYLHTMNSENHKCFKQLESKLASETDNECKRYIEG